MIPKIIHQSFINRESIKKVPTYEYCQKKLLELHPDFEYRFYSDSDMEIVMKENFPDYYENWTSLPKHIVKVDMFRYFIMYLYGGIYCDMDYLFLKKFDLFDKDCIICEECVPMIGDRTQCNGIRYGNSLFCSCPKNPFWKFLFDEVFHISKKINFGLENVLALSGPIFLSEMYEKFPEKEKIYVLEMGKINPKESLILKERYLGVEHPSFEKVIESLKIKNTCYGIHFCVSKWLKHNQLPPPEQLLVSALHSSKEL